MDHWDTYRPKNDITCMDNWIRGKRLAQVDFLDLEVTPWLGVPLVRELATLGEGPLSSG